VFAYVLLLVLVRISGKRAVKQENAIGLVMALVLGDLVDDAIWREVSAAMFVAATGTMFLVHAVLERMRLGVAAEKH